VAGVVIESKTDQWRVGDRVGTLHRDSCGTCASCARGETSLCEGAAFVFGILADGGYASRLIAPASALYALPEDLPAPHAAIFHCTFGTAYRDLVTLGKIQRGERVLVVGASGGVGVAAVQIAKKMGAHVTAYARGRHEELRALGADVVTSSIDGPFDLALDAVGAATFLSTLRALRIGGRVVVVGNIAHEKVALNLGLVITRGLTVIGGSGASPREMQELLALGEWKFVIDRTLPLARAEEAQALVRQGGRFGRVVVTPEEV
jgi:NADPH2:quinone reductase